MQFKFKMKRKEAIKVLCGSKYAWTTLALILTVAFSWTAPSVFAVGTEIELTGPPGSVQAGESFSVSVDLSGNPGFGAIQFTLSFDQNMLDCTKATTGALLQNALSASNPDSDTGVVIAAASSEVIQGDGNLGTFQFTAKTDLENPEFQLKDVILTDENGSDLQYNITISGQSSNPAEPEPLPSFSDTNDHWASDSIREAAAKGLLSGYADGTFRPDQLVTRGQMAVILWRMAEKPEPKATAPFTDIAQIPPDFQTAIAWGYETGRLNGTGPETYSPEKALTRQAAMKLLFNDSGGESGLELMLASIYDDIFTDSDQLADWARQPVYWAIYHEILTGNSQKALNPQKSVTRAQLSAILLRYLERFSTE